ncbi:sigma-54 interaction domain-containing protein [Oceanirhabdus sp. W0125-5]|uniref:sigma-54 interaction domain-containing protein n=1 Tax=Oceanirhabdus sp. W0125-5 TaxID=2999116 RepID=UPI0022F34398|nr:sigma 54-interacting transcriptional regulator [Oceanirhabdus sp. W0125-5]WBW98470.1 sigma 54-interacting transcriptional regulator [Oceanirhabdus sp. W0125-5]
MDIWGMFHEERSIYVYNTKMQLIFANDLGVKSRGLKDGMFNKDLFVIYGEVSALWEILKSMNTKKSIEGKMYSIVDHRGITHEVKSDFHGVYYGNNRFIIEIQLEEKNDFENGLNLNINKIRRKELYDFEDIITANKLMLKAKKKAYEASKRESDVLIYGETGTGKELIVQAIHRNSKRSSEPFIAQNCAAIPKGLFESTLFGTEKGSYTDSEKRKGIFELANGGTVYLDELNSMPMELQGKLLRVLQERKLRRVGGIKEINIDVRIIASINEDFESVLKNKKIRSDLFFRLNIISIELPALREKKDDIPILTRVFIDEFNKKFGTKILGVSQECMKHLLSYEWPGNVRELSNLIEGVFNNKSCGMIEYEDIKDKVRINNLLGQYDFKKRVQKFEKNLIEEALVLNNNNVSKAAKMLNIPRQTLQSKMKKM